MDSAAVLAKSMVTWVQGSGLRGMFTEPRVTPGTDPLARKLPNTQYRRPAFPLPASRDKFCVLATLMDSRCSSEVRGRDVPEYRYTRPSLVLVPGVGFSGLSQK